MSKKQKPELLLTVLFLIYMLLLVWIILFKLELSVDALVSVRRINLIPFYYAKDVGIRFHFKEVMENVLIFAPFGVYLCMFRHEPEFRVKFVILFGTSLILELLQYILAIGSCDITDLITNTFGGVLGTGIYYAAAKLFRNRERMNRVITVLAAGVTIVVVGGVAFLLAVNR